MLGLLRLSLVLASLANSAGPGDLTSLRRDQTVAGSFRVEAVYLDPSGAPKGARFRHERGTTVDVLFFDSVPQMSIAFRTPPDDDRGEPHALEHLLTTKGAAGRRINTLMSMRMAQFNAGTSPEATCYEFFTGAGHAEFDELLDVFLAALIRPDFTDEEARREVAHLTPLEENGRIKLEESGSVYNEMVSADEQPASIVWNQMGRMLYGSGHPLARDAGGDPEEMWNLTPAAIRAYHDAHYHLDANAGIVVSLPPAWSAADFLARLDSVIRELEPRAPARAYAGLPPFSPLAERAIRIGKFPSQDQTTPQDILMAWPPVTTVIGIDRVRLGLTADILGGDYSYLTRDIVDDGTRKVDSGASSVVMRAYSVPASYATFQVYGLPTTSITEPTLERLRGVLMERVRWLHDLKPGDPALAEIAVKARANIRSWRRSTLGTMNEPPHFGERGGDPYWHRFLERVSLQPGFAKSLGDDAEGDLLLKELDAGGNPWAPAIERAGMLLPPYVSAVLPDPGLMARQKNMKEERFRAKALRLAETYGVDEPRALERFRAETASATAALAALERDALRPPFLADPPLELDRIDWSESRLPSGPRLISTRFPTAFTDISVAFDLNGISAADRELLPLLAVAVNGVGVVTRAGDRVDSSKAHDMIQAEIGGADVFVNVDSRGDRAELLFTGRASSPEEIAGAVGWIENFMLRPDLSIQDREALKGWLVSTIQTKRAIFQTDDASWTDNAAAAYRYQDRPLYMHAASPFTMLRDLNRLRWRLEEPSAAQFSVLRASATAALAAARAADRGEAAGLLKGVDGEFGEYLRWEFSHLPDDSWRRDLGELIGDYLSDIGRSQETIVRLQRLIAQVLVRAGARVHIGGSPRNIETAARLADAVLARLPQGKKPALPKRRGLVLDRLRQRYPGLTRPTHVALVDEDRKTGAVVVTAPAAHYADHRRENLLDTLALGVLAGGGAHSLFLRTVSAGLAYSNGLGQYNDVGLVSYSATKCPDPVQTLRFVDDIAASFELNDPLQLEYSLAGAFGDYRANQGFSARGGALADDLESGARPETVRAFKTALLRVARESGTLAAVRARLLPALGRVLVGLPGGKVSASPEAAAFFIGPEELIRRYEGFVRERGEAARVIRLYPRDFWP